MHCGLFNVLKQAITGLPPRLQIPDGKTGVPYKSLVNGFRLAPYTIVSIVPEACPAIYDQYHEIAFNCLTTEEK